LLLEKVTIPITPGMDAIFVSFGYCELMSLIVAQVPVPPVCLEFLETVFYSRYDIDVKKKEGALSNE